MVTLNGLHSRTKLRPNFFLSLSWFWSFFFFCNAQTSSLLVMWLPCERLLPSLNFDLRAHAIKITKLYYHFKFGMVWFMNLMGSIQSEIVVKFFVLFCKATNFKFLFLQKSRNVLEHLLRSYIPCVALRMSRVCTNLEGITKSESSSVLSKA